MFAVMTRRSSFAIFTRKRLFSKRRRLINLYYSRRMLALEVVMILGQERKMFAWTVSATVPRGAPEPIPKPISTKRDRAPKNTGPFQGRKRLTRAVLPSPTCPNSIRRKGPCPGPQLDQKEPCPEPRFSSSSFIVVKEIDVPGPRQGRLEFPDWFVNFLHSFHRFSH